VQICSRKSPEDVRIATISGAISSCRTFNKEMPQVILAHGMGHRHYHHTSGRSCRHNELFLDHPPQESEIDSLEKAQTRVRTDGATSSKHLVEQKRSVVWSQTTSSVQMTDELLLCGPRMLRGDSFGSLPASSRSGVSSSEVQAPCSSLDLTARRRPQDEECDVQSNPRCRFLLI
jgi:hypothetical protein